MDLVVSLNTANMLRSARGAASVDLRSLLSRIPYAEVIAISRNGRYANVTVVPEQVPAFEAAVSEHCVVSPRQKAAPF